ncbi:hypothetical protein B0H14DRAFT_3494409 [Mycena olivaceomarginata]|nr:hypothetical protein B0H14DRAFT_3494409 [Mycena olivaceomarginata]
MPKILYVFGYSVWSAGKLHFALLRNWLLELGYSESEVTQKTVTLVNGDNFDPSFLKIYNPNFSMLVAHDEQELVAKALGLQGTFLPNRLYPLLLLYLWINSITARRAGQVALEKYIADPAAGECKDFYEPRIAANGGLLAIFTRKAPADVQAGYFVQSQAHFDAVHSALFEVYPEHLPTSGFIGREVPGEDDFHMITWVTHIAFIIGATSSADRLGVFERAYGAPVPVKMAAYWGAWAARESWKKVYAETLH